MDRQHWLGLCVPNQLPGALWLPELTTLCGRDDRLLGGMFKHEWFISCSHEERAKLFLIHRGKMAQPTHACITTLMNKHTAMCSDSNNLISPLISQTLQAWFPDIIVCLIALHHALRVKRISVYVSTLVMNTFIVLVQVREQHMSEGREGICNNYEFIWVPSRDSQCPNSPAKTHWWIN